MITWWHYLFLVNLYLVLFFVFYKIFLRKETFFQLNRIYLVAGSLLSFVIPLMQSEWVRQLFITRQVHQTLYAAVDPAFIYQIKPVESTPVTLGQIIAVIYITGAFILLGRLVYRLLLVKKLIDKNEAQSAFSFFRKIRVDESLSGKQTIIEHEEVHIHQWHSADVLLIEAVMIINWFNPIVYFYRKAIKHVHEFIADREAIQNGTSPAEYAILLLSQTFGTSPSQLTNNFFNHSLLKQRITMLNQDDSNRRALLKYGLSAPLFAAMLVFSSATVNNSKIIGIINSKTDQAFSISTVHFKNTLSVTEISADQAKKPADNKINASEQTVTIENVRRANNDQLRGDTIPEDKSSAVFNSVEVNPAFPGGEAAFGKFLHDHIRYPDKARENKVTGRVFISFVVEKDGSLTNFKTLRDPGSGLGEEAERVLVLSPKWSPGIQNGRLVRVQYTVPVNFSLANVAGQTKTPDTVIVRGTLRPQSQVAYLYKTQTDSAGKLYGKLVTNLKPWPEVLTIVDGKVLSSNDFANIQAQNI